MNKLFLVVISIMFTFMHMKCGKDVAGGVENGNPMLKGTIEDEDGNATFGAVVRLIPYDNNPRLNTSVTAATVSDKKGQYSFDYVEEGYYNIIGETLDGSLSFIDTVTIEKKIQKRSDNIVKSPGCFYKRRNSYCT